MSVDSDKKAAKFLSIASQFKLGKLVTELPHPSTVNLSTLASENLSEAISVLKDLDIDACKILVEKQTDVCALKNSIYDTLKSGSDIFLCGCGATGRLSLTIETIWRQLYASDDLKDRVFSFMAGGDVALIRSIENFEDFPEYGAMQLLEAGFKDGDLLIASTEGGETPFVIGAVEKAAKISNRKPFFLYCNPDDILCDLAERSRLILENNAIEKINLTVGPMAITGSTRMQSSTILLAAVGIALFYFNESDSSVNDAIDIFIAYWESVDIQYINKFIVKEAELYVKGEYLLYETDNLLGITVMTDTTERSPTFSLFPFENQNDSEQDLSLCYLILPETQSSELAWNRLLHRAPRTLEWPEINGIASRERLLGFDFSGNLLVIRNNALKPIRHQCFKILSARDGISFIFGNLRHFLKVPFKNPFFSHLILKMILNTQSTLVMGRLARYDGNIMTYVRASNNKLIDRVIRYVDLLLQRENIHYSYDKLAHILFEMLESATADQPIVLVTVNEIISREKREIVS